MARFLRGNDNFFRQPFLLLENGLTCQKLRKTALGNPLSAVYCSVTRQKLISLHLFPLQADATRKGKDGALHLPKTNSLDAKS